MRMAFAIAATSVLIPSSIQSDACYPPFSGHIFSSKSVATLSIVGVCVISDFVISAKINSRPPPTTKSRSARTYVVRMLSRILDDGCN